MTLLGLLVAVFKVLSSFSLQLGSLLYFVLLAQARLSFGPQVRLHRERPGVRGVGAGLGSQPWLGVTSGQTELIGRVDRGVHELGELVIRVTGGSRGWEGVFLIVSICLIEVPQCSVA